MGFSLGGIGKALGAVNPVAAIATAGLGFGDSLLQGYQNRKAAQKANKYAYTAWQLQNEYNTPKEQRERLEEAGYNPNLWYTNGNTGNAGTLSTSGYSAGDWSIGSKILNGLSQYQQFQASQANILNTQANTSNTRLQNQVLRQNLDYARRNDLPVGQMPTISRELAESAGPIIRDVGSAVQGTYSGLKDYFFDGGFTSDFRRARDWLGSLRFEKGNFRRARQKRR